jgi:hypothetical protein
MELGSVTKKRFIRLKIIMSITALLVGKVLMIVTIILGDQPTLRSLQTMNLYISLLVLLMLDGMENGIEMVSINFPLQQDILFN